MGTPRVYLGGSCGQTTWREKIAIPLLQKANLEYINPQLQPRAWSEDHEPVEIADKATCDVMLWVITADTRAATSVAEAVFYIAEKRPLALALSMLSTKSTVDGKYLSAWEVDDLNRGRLFLRSTAANAGLPIFTEVQEATIRAIELCGSVSRRLTASQVANVLSRIRCRNYRFVTSQTASERFLHVECLTKDENSGLQCTLQGRRWILEADYSVGDIVRTAFKAIMTWEEHELRECFYFDNARVFDPHFPVKLLK